MSNQLPWWLKPLNRVVIGLQRIGVAIGTMRVLSVPGRVSGMLRTTSVSPLTVDGKRYIVAGSDDSDWARNVRAAGWGVLAHDRKRERVALVGLPVEERAAVLRAFPRAVPHGVDFFRQLYGLPEDPDAPPEAFSGLAPRCPVFRIEPVTSTAASAHA